MRIFSIGDLHFGSGLDKPMDVFGQSWYAHQKKIEANWQKVVGEEDYVLVAGDISWAMKLNEAEADLNILNDLPGTKICIRGNHDYWWSKITKLNQLYERIYFLQNDAYLIGDLAICGTRGFSCPPKLEDERYKNWDQEHEKIYQRETLRLELSLKNAQLKGAKRIIVMLHYPPTNEALMPSGFTQLMGAYPVEQVVYGHLHDEVSQKNSLKGKRSSILYHLIAADYIDFTPKQIYL